jgi:hypothetical protein
MVHVTGEQFPARFAGEMAPKFDPWLIEASQYHEYEVHIIGAFPSTAFSGRQDGPRLPDYRFEAPR